MLIEKLERRQLLSTSALVGDGILVVRLENSGGNVIVQESAQNNTATVTDVNAGTVSTFSGVNVIVVLGSPAADSIAVITQNVPVFVDGGAGNDIIGVAANPIDPVTGAVNPSFNGAGSIILGGSGDDTILTQGLSCSAVFGGDGNDMITVEGENANGTLISSNDMIVSGGNGNDTILADLLSNSLIAGDNGNDLITNIAGNNDTVLGGNGNDTIVDTAAIGQNILNGGNGTDTITTSAGDCVQPSRGGDTVIPG